MWLTGEKTSKRTSLMLSSESEYRHSSVTLSPSRIGSVGPLMSKVAACGQRLQMRVIDHNMNIAGGLGERRRADLHRGSSRCSGQHFQNNLSLFLTFVSGACWQTANTLKVTRATRPATGSFTLLKPVTTEAICLSPQARIAVQYKQFTSFLHS